jgi:hypothetical protein
MEDLGKIQVALVSLLPQVSLGSGASFFLLRECLRKKISELPSPFTRVISNGHKGDTRP